MSQTEGRRKRSEPIEEPSEQEKDTIRAEETHIKTAGYYADRLHLLDDAGEPLCIERENHETNNWSNPKPIETYPRGYMPFCLYCIEIWREQR